MDKVFDEKDAATIILFESFPNQVRIHSGGYNFLVDVDLIKLENRLNLKIKFSFFRLRVLLKAPINSSSNPI